MSIDPSTSIVYPSIVQSSLSKQYTHRGPARKERKQFSWRFFGARIPAISDRTCFALEVEQISEDIEDRQQELSAAGIGNLPAHILNWLETRIHHENSKQKWKQTARRTQYESSSSNDFEDSFSTCSREDSDKGKYGDNPSSRKSAKEDSMEADLLKGLQ